MTELRQNAITREWVIIASERSKRPDDFRRETVHLETRSTYRHDCPFCLGNEDMTGPEVYRLFDDEGWRVRSVLNKYPALSPEGDRTRTNQNLFRSVSGVGFHEVIIEHPRHDLTTALLPIEDIVNILRVYRHRYSTLRLDPRVASILIFKNHGAGAGTSLEHPHSQLAATPIVPYEVRFRTQESIRYFDDTGICLVCNILADELAAGDRIIFTSEHFVAFIPYAALSPFHTWVFPRRHSSSFDDITDEEIVDLAIVLKTTLAKLYYGLGDPDYNYVIRSSPTDEQRTDYFHWYLAIVPRLSLTAGFELGSGMYINTSLPEESAEFLRSVEISS
ncbi:MAG: galactose-1-phosphate uridylyltransferase [Geitlerinemataceae cyanobacterium]